MSAKGIVADPNCYEDGAERRTLDLRPDGIACIPLLGLSNFQSVRIGTEEHVHPGCIEICLCLRGRLFFASQGSEYPFFPGTIFVSQPHEPHCVRNNPKGLRLMWILFSLPKDGATVLGLGRRESQWVVGQLRRFPVRLFPATERVKGAFERLFAFYDSERRGTVSRRLRLKAAVLELLLAIIDAPRASPTPKGKANPRVSAIVRRMRESPEAEYSIAQLAAEAALSAVAFTDAFKRTAGLPPHAFLLDQRVRAADRLLADAAVTVADAARRYRFTSPQHLASAFRQILGRPPRRIK